MIRHGVAPFIECSSHGEKRLSAFYARVQVDRLTASIEHHYQAFKIFEDGTTGLTWRQAKGRKAVNQAEASEFYSMLWDLYIARNPSLMGMLREATGLQDKFGQEGHCCQATELWRIKLKDEAEL